MSNGKDETNPFGYSDEERGRVAIVTERGVEYAEALETVFHLDGIEPNSWRDLMMEVREILAPAESPGVDIRDTVRMLMESHRLLGVLHSTGCCRTEDRDESAWAGVDRGVGEPLKLDEPPRMERRIGEVSSRWEMRTPTAGEFGYVGEAVQAAIDEVKNRFTVPRREPEPNDRFMLKGYGEVVVVGAHDCDGCRIVTMIGEWPHGRFELPLSEFLAAARRHGD